MFRDSYLKFIPNWLNLFKWFPKDMAGLKCLSLELNLTLLLA